MAVSSALCAWGVARTDPDRFPLFLSAPFFLALSLGQWSPLLVAAALLPALAPLIVAKPNLGAAVWLAAPRFWPLAGGAAIVAISLVVMPEWPAAWLANVSGREEKVVPVLHPGGVVLLLALIAWRRPEARLLAVLSVVPQALLFYDQLLLWLVPRSRRQSIALSLASLVLFLAWRWSLAPGDFEVRRAIPYAFALYPLALSILLWNWYRDRRVVTTPNELGGGAAATAAVAPGDRAGEDDA
jgi:hypothetical protein